MKNSPAQPAAAAVRAFALTFPEAYEEFPWGESAFKVKGKVFVFLYAHPDGMNVSLKLPHSGDSALDQPFAEPTGYGLGKSGWVTSKFEREDRVPLELLQRWIGESYRAVAPKSLVKALDGGAAQPVRAAQPRASTAAKDKPARKPEGRSGAKRSTPAKPKSSATRPSAAVSNARVAPKRGTKKAPGRRARKRS